MNLDVSVVICVLNEERNIGECIEAVRKNNPKEIIVIDGGSTDRTVRIARRIADKVIVAGRRGLAYQRQVGIDAAKGKYVALIDADHRVTNNCFAILIKELELNNYDGIEAQILSVENTGYWDWAMEQNFKMAHNFPGQRNMIGTPCIYKREVLAKERFDPFFTGPGDDTDLCYRLTEKGYKLGVGTALIYQRHRDNFGEFWRKCGWYGKGDAQFFWKHPKRRLSIMAHPIINYAIKRSIKALKMGKIALVPFFVLSGLFRHYGFLKWIIKLAAWGGQDREIYRT